MEKGLVEFDVGPAETQSLARPQSERHSDSEKRSEPVDLGGIENLPRFFGSERSNLLALDGDRIHGGRDISLDESPSQRHIQRGAESRVNILHCPWCKPLSTKIVQQPLHHRRGELGEADVADYRNDVPPDVAFVSAPCR
jgi:hypothetical protein